LLCSLNIFDPIASNLAFKMSTSDDDLGTPGIANAVREPSGSGDDLGPCGIASPALLAEDDEADAGQLLGSGSSDSGAPNRIHITHGRVWWGEERGFPNPFSACTFTLSLLGIQLQWCGC
jgi:hypothetical protein